jgi:branched-chain amino acid transport system ATP-binding protein
MEKKPLLDFKNVSASYGLANALSDISLEVYTHEIVTLIGANGAGKTTLMMSVYGQPRIQGGTIHFQDKPIHHLPTHDIAKLGISLCPERRRIFVKMSTEENLFLGANTPSAKENLAKNMENIFSLFPILKERRNQRAGTLSGGEQQMLAMGRSLMAEPKLFLLDEPSLGLAPQISAHIFKLLKEIAQAGTTILLAEQNAYRALQLADRAYVIVNGEIRMTGSGEELLHNKEIQKAYLAGEEVLSP